MSGRIVGPYAIQGLLGSGGIGHVYSALDQDLGRQVALKALRPEFSHDPDLLERFRGEAANLARLNHPNITTLYSLYRETNTQRQNVFMVMELVNGETLEAILARLGRLSTPVCLAVIAQATAGLSYAHSVGLIHRDIKPSNMMLNDVGLLKITDFGIARVQGSQRLTRHGAMVGTLNYIAPEQIKGHECDERSDLYSLACVLYELLSGSKPFVGQTEYELIRAQLEVDPEPLTASMPDLEPHIDQAVMRALAKNPDDRFSSVAEFAETLGTSAVQDSAVAIVKEQVRAAGRPSNESRHGEGLVLDDPSSDPHSILSTSVFQGLSGLQPPEVQAPPRPRKPRRAMAAVAAAVLVIVMGGSYYVYRVEQNSSALVIKATPELPGNPVETPAAPPPGKPAIAQAAPPPAPGKPAITQAPAPSRQPSAPTLSQYDHPGPEEASTQAQSSAASQSSASSQQAQTETVAPADDGTKPSSPPQPPATDATTAKTIAGLVSSYSQDGWPVINGVTIRLDGVGALAPGQAKPVSDWIAIHGNYLDCTASQIGEYRCLTQQNLDLAQAILLNGAARTSTDAAPAYRDAEANARIAKRGLWR